MSRDICVIPDTHLPHENILKFNEERDIRGFDDFETPCKITP